MTRFFRRTAATGLLAASILLLVSCERGGPAKTRMDDPLPEQQDSAKDEGGSSAEAGGEFAQATPAAEPLSPVPSIEDSRSPRDWLASIRNAEQGGSTDDAGVAPIPADRERPEKSTRTVETAENPAEETIGTVRRLLEGSGLPPSSVSGGSRSAGEKGDLHVQEVEARFADDVEKRVLVFKIAAGGKKPGGDIFDGHFAPFAAAGYYIRPFDGPGERAARTNTFDRDLEAIVWQQDGVLVAAVGFVPAESQRIHASAIDTGLYGEVD